VHGPFMKTPVKSNVFHLFLGKVQLVMLRRPTVSDVPATGLRAHTYTRWRKAIAFLQEH